MDLRKEKLENKLNILKVKGEIANVVKGARITRYELKLDPQQKLNPVINLAKDIGLTFGQADNVRVAAVPNKEDIVGIEIPNTESNCVNLSDILQSKEFITAESKTTFVVGESVDGEVILGDIKKMPHLLIAGTTGSGKSVGMNGLIISVLHKATADDVKFVMIDPKKVEFTPYSKIPHLLAPIITEPNKAMQALQWTVEEMERRYDLCAAAGVRDFDRYNAKAAVNGGEILPRIIVVIDELADLMMASESQINGNLKIRNKIEVLISRLAQKARASGIHLVVATQRPSKDVVTGLIKDNIPSKIAYTVADRMASMIVLDELGAEKLLGAGDSLYKPVGEKAQRVQSAYISDDEVENFADSIATNEPMYNCDLIDALTDEEQDDSLDNLTENEKFWAWHNANKPPITHRFDTKVGRFRDTKTGEIVYGSVKIPGVR